MFVGLTEADASPLEVGVYLIPAGAVETRPPDTWPDRQWPRWNGVTWELVTRPDIASAAAAIEKLRAFLASNPEVAELIGK